MTANVVSGSVPFGAMSNAIPELIAQLNDKITRLNGAVDRAESGYGGVAGTEFEGTTTNNFGVLASTTPGAKGGDWAFAVGNLASNWATFMTNAGAYITALDNG